MSQSQISKNKKMQISYLKNLSDFIFSKRNLWNVTIDHIREHIDGMRLVAGAADGSDIENAKLEFGGSIIVDHGRQPSITFNVFQTFS